MLYAQSSLNRYGYIRAIESQDENVFYSSLYVLDTACPNKVAAVAAKMIARFLLPSFFGFRLLVLVIVFSHPHARLAQF